MICVSSPVRMRLQFSPRIVRHLNLILSGKIQYLISLAPTKPCDKISILDPDDGLGFQSSGTKLFPADFCQLDFGDFEGLKFRALPLSLHHWLMVSRNTLVCVMPGEKSSSFLLTVEFENGSALVK
jgi:hypothetical protein